MFFQISLLANSHSRLLWTLNTIHTYCVITITAKVAAKAGANNASARKWKPCARKRGESDCESTLGLERPQPCFWRRSLTNPLHSHQKDLVSLIFTWVPYISQHVHSFLFLLSISFSSPFMSFNVSGSPQIKKPQDLFLSKPQINWARGCATGAQKSDS